MITTTAVVAPTAQQSTLMFDTFFGIEINMMAIAITLIMSFIIILFYNIQKSNKLDFADMVTKDGRAVSLTKVLQLIGGLTSTWIMIKLTLTGGLTEALFGLYLTYVGAIEGYSKFVAAKYNYTETSVKDAAKEAAKTE
jgi:amino acid transporter